MKFVKIAGLWDEEKKMRKGRGGGIKIDLVFYIRLYYIDLSSQVSFFWTL